MQPRYPLFGGWSTTFLFGWIMPLREVVEKVRAQQHELGPWGGSQPLGRQRSAGSDARHAARRNAGSAARSQGEARPSTLPAFPVNPAPFQDRKSGRMVFTALLGAAVRDVVVDELTVKVRWPPPRRPPHPTPPPPPPPHPHTHSRPPLR